MSAKPGERVGAIFGSSKDGEKRVQLLGYGVYTGDEVPVDAAGFIADALREFGNPNPRIDLDFGYAVWGCECWWGPEIEVMKLIDDWMDAGYIIETVDLREIRKKYAAPVEPDK